MKKKENHLLIIGAAIYCCTIIIFLVFWDKSFDITKLSNLVNFKLFVIISLFVAPLIEELTFRANFLNNKYLKYFSLILIFAYIFITNNFYLLFFFIPYVIAFFFKEFKILNFNINFLFFFNSLIFALMHYNQNFLKEGYDLIPIFFQFSFGLVLIWVTINYGLKKSIFTHFIYNFVFISIIFYDVQFPDTRKESMIFNNIKFTWERTPVFSNSNTIFKYPNESEIVANNVTITRFMKIYNLDNINYTVTENPFINYNIQIVKMDTICKKLRDEEVLQLLTKANLIEK